MKNKLVFVGKVKDVLPMLKMSIEMAKINQAISHSEERPTLKAFLENEDFLKSMRKLLTNTKYGK